MEVNKLEENLFPFVTRSGKMLSSKLDQIIK